MANVQRGTTLTQIYRLFDEGTLAGLPDGRLLERYVVERDELAFETLVKRHGPMVTAVCRGVVEDPHDADDVFQAAFLLLARKAKSLWVDESLGGWLHRVASRIALQVRSESARRRDRERRSAELSPAQRDAAAAWDDTPTVVHEEIDRLPERYRRPIVLCYLEEMTYEQAASLLRWSEGTTRGRLAKGRELLRARLSRRGIQSAGSAMPALPAAARLAAPSPELLQSTVRAARHFTLGNTAQAATVSARTAGLVKQALQTMMVAKLKLAGAAALLIAMLACVATGLAAVGPVRSTGTVSAKHTAEAGVSSLPAAEAPRVELLRRDSQTSHRIRSRFKAACSGPTAGQRQARRFTRSRQGVEILSVRTCG